MKLWAKQQRQTMKTNKKKSVCSNSLHPEKKKKCPFIRSPDKDCYFLDMNSNEISMAIYYCRNHYMQCAIYKRIKREKPTIGNIEI